MCAYARKEPTFQKKKMLAKYPLAVKHVFRFRVSATDRFYFFFYFSLRSVVSSSSNSLCCKYHWRYSIKSNQFISVTSASTALNYSKNRFKLSLPLWSLYWTRLFGQKSRGWKPRIHSFIYPFIHSLTHSHTPTKEHYILFFFIFFNFIFINYKRIKYMLFVIVLVIVKPLL